MNPKVNAKILVLVERKDRSATSNDLTLTESFSNAKRKPGVIGKTVRENKWQCGILYLAKILYKM